MQKLENHYTNLCKRKSDVREHLPILRRYASKVKTITEFGFRTGRSTAAMLVAQPKKLTTYDITGCKKYVDNLKAMVPSHINFVFIQGDTLKVEIEKTELLFIDSWHVGPQLKAELIRHASKVEKYIILHDTETFKLVGEDIISPGLQVAIDWFLRNNQNWHIHEVFKNNNGLTVLKKS